MITPDLIDYIKKQLDKKFTKEAISSKLILAGWHEEDVEKGFLQVEKILHPVIETKPETIPENKTEIKTDIKPEIKSEIKVDQPQTENKPKVWTPISAKPPVVVAPLKFEKVNASPASPEVKPIITPPLNTPAIPVKPTITPNPNPLSIPIKPVAISNLPPISSTTPHKDILQPTPPRGSKMFKLFLIFIVVLVLSAGFIYIASSAGYIKIPNLPFVKKDPKNILSEAPVKISSLSSYKMETNINLSSPLFSNIASGLMSGEAVNSNDQDSVSLDIKSIFNKNKEDSASLSFDHSILMKDSFLKDPMTFVIKSNSKNTVVDMPSLSQIIGPNAPEASVVLVPADQFDFVTPIFDDSTSNIIKKFDIYQVLSKGVPNFVSTKVYKSFQNFVSNVDILEKENEKIDGLDTYHYQVNPSGQDTKKFFEDISSIFLATISKEDRTRVEDGLSSVSINSLEFWVGKEDGMVHKYKFTLTLPLSKVIGVDDKGIAGSEVKLDLQSKLYDFNVPNIISLPVDTVPMAEYVKSLHNTKIKNAVSSFKSSSVIFHNSTHNYGLVSNSNGSCTNPKPGSLFSPLGHNKNASLSVGDIANNLNKIISLSPDMSYCYSSSAGWALAVPLSGDTPTYYCEDSKGASTILDKPLVGNICK